MAFSRPWIPFREMGELRRNIDEMLEHLRGRIGYSPGSMSTAGKPPIESFVEEGKLIVRAELPGIDPKEITVNVVGDMLMIRASRQEEHETKKRVLRHWFASAALESGVPLDVVAQLLGHSGTTMTERYSHLSNKFIGRFLN